MSARNRAVRSSLFEPGYSTVWEDERIVDEGLRPRAGERMLVITSGGCISLKLLLADVAEVVSVDLRAHQTALLQVKAAAARSLSHAELWEFLGLTASARRSELYRRVRAALSPEVARYWDDRPGELATGVTVTGRHDRLRHAIGRAVQAIQGRRLVDRLLACATLDEQRAFVDGDWNTRRWRALLRVSLSKHLLGRAVETPSTTNQAAMIRNEIDHVLRRVPVVDNFYLHYMFRRSYPSAEVCPAWLVARNQPIVADRVDRLRPSTEALETFLASPAAGTFDGFYLSNIFDWMSPSEFDHAIDRIIRVARQGARLCYWTNTLNQQHELAPARFPAVRQDRAAAAAIMANHRVPGYSACVVATIEAHAR